MKDDEKQLIKWVESSNSFQKQALDTIAENEVLKAQVNYLLEAIEDAAASKCLREAVILTVGGRADHIVQAEGIEEYPTVLIAGVGTDIGTEL